MSTRAVLIQIRDVPALVQSQGGYTGSLIQRLVPDTIEAQVYSRMASDIKKGLTDKGVAADVTVVSPNGVTPAVGGDFFKGAVVGALVFALGGYLMKHVIR